MDTLEANQVGESSGEVVTAFDVSAFELDDVGVLTVQNLQRTEDLTYNGKPVLIKVYSPGSAQAVKVLHKVARQATLRMQGLLRGAGVSQDSAEQADAERVAKLVGITQSIENFPIPGGTKALYANPRLSDIADQVDAFFNNKANFAKGNTAS